MNPVALKTAARTGFPIDHIIGNIWSNAEEDVVPAGDAAKGYIAHHQSVGHQTSRCSRRSRGRRTPPARATWQDPKRFGSIYYNLRRA